MQVIYITLHVFTVVPANNFLDSLENVKMEMNGLIQAKGCFNANVFQTVTVEVL